MHEIEKQEINLIYNHNFQEKFNFFFLFLCVQDNKKQNYTKSFKGKLQAWMKNSTLLPGKDYSGPTYPTLTNLDKC